MSVTDVRFGWLSPVAGHAGSDFQPIVMYQEEHVLPQVLPHFASVWIADHFPDSDAASEAWCERLTHLRGLGVSLVLWRILFRDGTRSAKERGGRAVQVAGRPRRAIMDSTNPDPGRR